jgi:ubiquinone/menaquinone biosynthesis C-methylase UbiE
MSLTINDWHQRYLQQAAWSRTIRDYLSIRSGLHVLQTVLEVGCGTGAILKDLLMTPGRLVFGVDNNINHLRFTIQKFPRSLLSCGNAHHLPFKQKSFDACVCHYFFLWLSDPLHALGEMVRVTRSGGIIIAFAEPDYGGRIDYPKELEVVSQWQSESLRKQGADPDMGRKLRSLFTNAGLKNIESGVMGGEWKETEKAQDIEMEWSIIRSDLSKDIDKTEQLKWLEEIDRSSREQNTRIQFIPTFYTWGRIP